MKWLNVEFTNVKKMLRHIFGMLYLIILFSDVERIEMMEIGG